MTFNVTAKKSMFRPTELTKRFFVEDIDSSDTQHGVSNLYYLDDNTEIVFNDSESSALDQKSGEVLTAEYIGGLMDQIQALNRCLRRVIQEAKDSIKYAANVKINEVILLHGFEGTGKTMIMEHLERAKLCKVTRLEKSILTAGTCTASLFRHSNTGGPAAHHVLCFRIPDEYEMFADLPVRR